MSCCLDKRLRQGPPGWGLNFLICTQWPSLPLSKLVLAPPALPVFSFEIGGQPHLFHDSGWGEEVSETHCHHRQSLREAAMQVPESYLLISGIINVYKEPLITLFINDLWVLWRVGLMRSVLLYSACVRLAVEYSWVKGHDWWSVYVRCWCGKRNPEGPEL